MLSPYIQFKISIVSFHGFNYYHLFLLDELKSDGVNGTYLAKEDVKTVNFTKRGKEKGKTFSLKIYAFS